MVNKVIRCTAENNNIRIFLANTTNMVEKARQFHLTSPVASAALGRTLTMTSIMGLMLKSDKHSLTVRINGGGELGTILAVSDGRGNVKGYVTHPQVKSSLIAPGKLDVAKAVGVKGDLNVVKDLGLKEPYIGTSPLVSGEIGEDFANYFLRSQQEPSAVALGVLVDKDYSIKAAGGMLVQTLPGIPEATVNQLEERLLKFKSITSLMEDGMNERDILNYIFEDMNPKILASHKVDFLCDCTRHRLEQALISIGKKELEEIILEDSEAQLVCHFCNKKYNFDKRDLNKLLRELG